MAKPLDWTKTGTVVAMAEWLRKASGALAVVVIRRDDSALAVDAEMPPGSVTALVEGHLPGLSADLAAARTEKRKGARLELGELQE